MKVVIAVDSLKGSLSSIEAAQAAKEGILKVYPAAEVVIKPLADGGTAICFFNKTSHSAGISYNLNKLCSDGYVSLKAASSYALCDQWTGETLNTNGKLKLKLKKYQCKVYIIK